jgi:hypothetical protein
LTGRDLIDIVNGECVQAFVTPPHLTQNTHPLDFELADEVDLIVNTRVVIDYTLETFQRVPNKVGSRLRDLSDFCARNNVSLLSMTFQRMYVPSCAILKRSGASSSRYS